MNRSLIWCIILSSCCVAANAQEIALKSIHRKTISPDYIRYEYFFSTTNHSAHRLHLFVNVSLMDSDKAPLDERFMFFETRPGHSQTSSIESDVPPGQPGDGEKRACFYRMHIRDDALNTVYERDGSIQGVAVTHQRG